MPDHLCEHCGYKGKWKGSLNRHLSDIHDINVVWVYCAEKMCGYRTKQKGHLKQQRLRPNIFQSWKSPLYSMGKAIQD